MKIGNCVYSWYLQSVFGKAIVALLILGCIKHSSLSFFFPIWNIARIWRLLVLSLLSAKQAVYVGLDTPGHPAAVRRGDAPRGTADGARSVPCSCASETALAEAESSQVGAGGRGEGATGPSAFRRRPPACRANSGSQRRSLFHCPVMQWVKRLTHRAGAQGRASHRHLFRSACLVVAWREGGTSGRCIDTIDQQYKNRRGEGSQEGQNTCILINKVKKYAKCHL